jgi:hypothetical protein
MSETAKPSGVFLAGTPTALALFGALGVGAAATPEDRLGSLFAELRRVHAEKNAAEKNVNRLRGLGQTVQSALGVARGDQRNCRDHSGGASH